jgi:hypothetical protein
MESSGGLVEGQFVLSAHWTVMGQGVVLAKIFGTIFCSPAPMDEQVPLMDTILDPIETHVNRLLLTLVPFAMSASTIFGGG